MPLLAPHGPPLFGMPSASSAQHLGRHGPLSGPSSAAAQAVLLLNVSTCGCRQARSLDVLVSAPALHRRPARAARGAHPACLLPHAVGRPGFSQSSSTQSGQSSGECSTPPVMTLWQSARDWHSRDHIYAKVVLFHKILGLREPSFTYPWVC
jgi:hypothetical protein